MKGSMVDQYKVGERVTFKTDIGHDVHKTVQDEEGKPKKIFSHHVPVTREDPGRILKLHKSGTNGTAEIRPEAGVVLPVTANRKVSWRLQFVTKA